MSTQIRPCMCKNSYQDEKYGPGNRVHNKGKGPTKDRPIWRCTVCSKEKQNV